MKLKKYKYLVVAGALITGTFLSCSNDYLDVEAKGQFLSSTYYANQSQAFSGLVAVYDVMRKNSGGFDNMLAMMNSGSDDHYAGGGNASDGQGLQDFSGYKMNSISMPNSYWSDHYQGIFRANILLLKLPDVPMDASLISRYTAETKALRANYYFNLVRMFKNIPLLTAPVDPSEMYSVTQANPEDVYAQIEKDLLEAIPALPGTIDKATEAGRFTKGAAQALLGKVYLYEGKNALAAAQFAQVNGTPGATSQYGYSLLANFGELWGVSNKFNSESILEVAHTNQSLAGWGNWGSGTDEGNSYNVMVGPRTYSRNNPSAPDIAAGWSFNPITQDLYDLLKTDPRFNATVLDMKALKAAGDADYIPGNQDTGYFLRKFMPTNADVTTLAGDAVLNYRQNSYVIRLADTYLMEAEALGGTGARAQALLDAVRARVGLASVPVSLNAVMAERRLELAGEGHRWFDLVRTGKAATVLASRGFVAGKNEIFPIPYKELENTKIIQNPNYN
ncbi:RagB/SusD family nutrient uptake outer membrane protein [Mariniflexile sp.]|uniref:RagB/SusD family nutrient uptake outer membrane protein n=1 Tax=Mariniflexile sp. TaxID=1979402 RepID=UPI0040480D96